MSSPIHIPAPVHDDGAALAAVMKEIYEGIPAGLNISGVVSDAAERIVERVPGIPQDLLRAKLVEVLTEIAAYTVEQFTRRTGRPFEWHDEPEVTDPDPVMCFEVDDKGNVVFGGAVQTFEAK